jgi:hypothetical protein
MLFDPKKRCHVLLDYITVKLDHNSPPTMSNKSENSSVDESNKMEADSADSSKRKATETIDPRPTKAQKTDNNSPSTSTPQSKDIEGNPACSQLLLFAKYVIFWIFPAHRYRNAKYFYNIMNKYVPTIFLIIINFRA